MSPVTILEQGPNAFTKGVGTVLMINGTGGQTSLDPFNAIDGDAQYFAAWWGNNGQERPASTGYRNPTYGSGYFRVTPTRIDGGYRAAVPGVYKDDYVIA